MEGMGEGRGGEGRRRGGGPVASRPVLTEPQGFNMRTDNWPLVTGESACVAIPALPPYTSTLSGRSALVRSQQAPILQVPPLLLHAPRPLAHDTPVHEGLVTEVAGDPSEQFISQRLSELPVESWDDDL